MAEILTVPPLHPRAAAPATRRSHGRNTRSQTAQTEAGPIVITEVTEIQAEAEGEAVPLEHAEGRSHRTENQERHRLLRERNRAREAAVSEQDAANRITFGEFLEFPRVSIAFNVGPHREVGELRREDLEVFFNGCLEMTDSSIRVVIW